MKQGPVARPEGWSWSSAHRDGRYGVGEFDARSVTISPGAGELGWVLPRACVWVVGWKNLLWFDSLRNPVRRVGQCRVSA